MVTKRSIIIADKEDNQVGSTASYAYARDADGTMNEIARNIYTVDSAGAKGTISLGTLATDDAGQKTIENALELDHQQAVIKSTSSLDSTQTNETAINYDGINFSTDTASIYFGADKQFRIRFGLGDAPSGGNTLSFQSKANDGSYNTRMSFTDEQE